MLSQSNLFQNARRENPITPAEAYDPAYWRQCAERARKRALDAPHDEFAAALKREAADYERLAGYAAAILLADEVA